MLDGTKTMTRRAEPCLNILRSTYLQQGMSKDVGVKPNGEIWQRIEGENSYVTIGHSRYKVGEVVAIAQSYESMANGGYLDIMLDENNRFKAEFCGSGYTNKMFVKADLMPHQIRITDIKVERLQDISDGDCLLEGIYEDYEEHGGMYTTPFYDYKGNDGDGFCTPREAFSSLIDKVSGKGTWERNPWVFAYSFELVK